MGQDRILPGRSRLCKVCKAFLLQDGRSAGSLPRRSRSELSSSDTAACLVARVLEDILKQLQASNKAISMGLAVSLFNPLVCAISSRGSADSLSSLMIVGMLQRLIHGIYDLLQGAPADTLSYQAGSQKRSLCWTEPLRW